MAGLVPAIHVLRPSKEGMDARNKCGHDAVFQVIAGHLRPLSMRNSNVHG
jgi:hypothetical protein